MGKEHSPKRVLVSESQFRAALRVIILERLISEGQEPTEGNIQSFEERARDNWVKVPNGRVFPEWHLVLHEAAKLSIAMAERK